MRMITTAWGAVKAAAWIILSLIFAAVRCTTTCGREEELVW